MFWTLLKKQLLEINWTFFVDKKTGKVKPKSKAIGSIILFIVLMGFVSVSFASFTYMIIKQAVKMNAAWFGFSISSLLALIFGVVGSVFNTFGMLYKSKDNELLTSMPIPARDILLSRVCGAFAMSLLYTSLVMLPAIVLYQIFAGFHPYTLLTSLLMLLVESVIVTVVTCALGYVVAIISSKVKNKSLTSVFATLVFFAAYYMFVFRIDEIMQNLLVNFDSISASFSRVYALYVLGNAYMGNVVPMIIVVAIAAVLLLVTLKIMSANFFKIANIKDVQNNKKFEMKQIKTSSVTGTLIKKELNVIFNTPIYLLNCGLGILFMLIGMVVLLIKSQSIGESLMMIMLYDIDIYEVVIAFLPLAIVIIISMIVSMDAFSASSISLEGKNIWQLQCLPVKYKEILNAKAYTCIFLNGIPAMLLAIVACFAVKLDIISSILAVCGVIFVTIFLGYFGLLANILSPNFKWTNPTTVVKQSGAVMVSLFGGWVLMVASGYGAYYFTMKLCVISPTIYLAIMDVLFLIGGFVLRIICEKKGTKLLRDI